MEMDIKTYKKNEIDSVLPIQIASALCVILNQKYAKLFSESLFFLEQASLVFKTVNKHCLN